jgi:RHS repeat-associated protein
LTELVEVQNSVTVLDEKLTYDVFDNLIGVSVGGTQQRWSVYDGKDLYADLNSTGSTVSKRYLGDPFGSVAAGSVNWYLTDLVGSNREILGGSGTVVDRVSYDPFGGVFSETGTGDRIRFDGGDYDANLAMSMLQDNWYDPADGRWTSAGLLGWGDASNLYEYMNNDPMDSMDLSLVAFTAAQELPFPLDPLPLPKGPYSVIINDFGANADIVNYLHTILSFSLSSNNPNIITVPAPSIKAAVETTLRGTGAAKDLTVSTASAVGLLGSAASGGLLFAASALTPSNAKIKELVFFGHGLPGEISVGHGSGGGQSTPATANEFLEKSAFTDPNGQKYAQLVQLRSMLTPDATITFKGCNVFSGKDGQAFAQAASDFFTENGKYPNRVVTGAVGTCPFTTYESLKSGEQPNWANRPPAANPGNGTNAMGGPVFKATNPSFWDRILEALANLGSSGAN